MPKPKRFPVWPKNNAKNQEKTTRSNKLKLKQVDICQREQK